MIASVRSESPAWAMLVPSLACPGASQAATAASDPASIVGPSPDTSLHEMQDALDVRVAGVSGQLAEVERAISLGENKLRENNQRIVGLAHTVDDDNHKRLRIQKVSKVAAGTAIVGCIGLLGGCAAALFNPLGAVVGFAGGALAVSGAKYLDGLHRQDVGIYNKSVDAINEIQRRIGLQQSLSQALEATQEEQAGLLAELKSLGGQREVIDMAGKDSSPLVGVKVDEDFIMVGNLRVPRQPSPRL